MRELSRIVEGTGKPIAQVSRDLGVNDELACAAIKMAVAARGGRDAIWREVEDERVIFHTDRG